MNVESDMVVPNDTPMPFTFAMSQVNATQASGGSYKVVDARTFPVSTTVCSAEVSVEVGGMRFVILIHVSARANQLYYQGTSREGILLSSEYSNPKLCF